MRHLTRKFMAQFKDRDFRVLWCEILVFSGVLGGGFRSWLVFGLAFAGLNWLVQQRNGQWYAVLAISGIWGYIAAAIGHSFGGWAWAGILGGGVFIKGVLAHKRELKRSWVEIGLPKVINSATWRQNWNWRGRSLN